MKAPTRPQSLVCACGANQKEHLLDVLNRVHDVVCRSVHLGATAAFTVVQLRLGHALCNIVVSLRLCWWMLLRT
jgi:hypothetical protein